MPNTILATTDLSARGDRALRRALRLANDHGAALHVLHVIDDAIPEDIAQTLRDTAETTLTRFIRSMKGGDAVTVTVVHGDPITSVVDAIKVARPDLLVMGTHRTRPFFDSWRETTAQHITRLVDCPVLIVKDAEDKAYDTVLAATDFSPTAAAAIDFADTLAPGATITPVHAYHVPYRGMLAHGAGGSDELEAIFRTDAQDADVRWRASNTLPASCGETVLMIGQPRHALSTVATDKAAPLICAGAHGRVGQGRALLGSTALDLMRAPPCDVLIVHPA